MPDKLRVFSGSSNPELAQEIADRLYLPMGEITITRFSNENIKVKINESVRGKDVFVIQTSCPPVSDHIMELLVMLHAFKGASADRVTAVLPYFPYVRSDKKDEPRISITAKLMADLLATAGADRILTMDLHAAQIQGYFDMPADQRPVEEGHDILLEHPAVAEEAARTIGRIRYYRLGAARTASSASPVTIAARFPTPG